MIEIINNRHVVTLFLSYVEAQLWKVELRKANLLHRFYRYTWKENSTQRHEDTKRMLRPFCLLNHFKHTKRS